ncbi:MAG: ferritin family protein [Candidatus Bathyarchaeaceae archaeon]
MKTEKTLSNLIKEQIKLEKETAKKFSVLEGRVDSVAARLLIHEMQLDTKKHAEILEAALKVIGGSKSLWEFTVDIEADKRAVKKELEEHIRVEETMMRQVESESKKTDDEALKLLLQHFAEDEKKHHKILETIINKAYKMEL